MLTKAKEERQRHEHEALGHVVKCQASSSICNANYAVVCQARYGRGGDPHPHDRPVPVICIGCQDSPLECHGEEDQPHDQRKAKAATQQAKFQHGVGSRCSPNSILIRLVSVLMLQLQGRGSSMSDDVRV